MAGKRLLDLAALFNASRGVTQKHIALRSRQLDVYNRTSTLARAVRNQTDRVTETAKAASFLASRLNEDEPAWASDTRDDKPPRQTDEIDPLPGRTIHPREPDIVSENDDPLPTSSNTSSIGTSTASTISSNAARTLQRQFEHQIPSQTADAGGDLSVDPLGAGHDEDNFYQRSGHTSPVLSSLPRVKIPKHPSNSQGSTVDSPAAQINSDSFYNNREPQGAGQGSPLDAVPEEEQIPEGINTNLFHSRRVARALGGNIQGDGRASGFTLNGLNKTRVEHSKLAADKRQETSNAFISPQIQPTSPDTAMDPLINSESSIDADGDIEKLAQAFRQEIQSDIVEVYFRTASWSRWR
jgi:aarF domain-containing kinase